MTTTTAPNPTTNSTQVTTVLTVAKIASGRTQPGATNWQKSNDYVYVDVDTSAAGFAKTPVYVTSIGGDSQHYGTTGASSVYSATATGFRIFIRWDKGFKDTAITPEEANGYKWHINWIAIEPFSQQGTDTQPSSGSLSHLANKEFYIRNRWQCEQNDSRCDKHLSFSGENLVLASKDDTANLVPWKFIPVPGKTDEFYIRNRWQCQQNDPRCDKHLSFSGDNLVLAAKDNTADLVPWKFIPVPGKTDEFYIRNQWHCEQNDRRCDKHLSFSGDKLVLAAKDNTADLVPWKLVPAN